MVLHLHRFVRILGICVALAGLLTPLSARALIVSELSVEMSGSWMTTSDGRSNLGLFLEINVPLDPRRPSSVHGALLQEEQTTPPEDVPLDVLERDTGDGAPDVDPNDAAWGEAAPAGLPLPEPLQIDRQFLGELTQAALVAQGCDDAWSRLEHLGTRNRVSALLPEVALRAGRERDTALRLAPTDTDPYRYTMSGATNLLLEGRLSWRLGRLLFSAEDLGIERLRLARSRERQRVVERAMAVLFQWLKAESELASGRRLTQRQARVARWERTQAELRLDVLTAGWFSSHRPAPVAASAAKREAPEPARPESAPPAPIVPPGVKTSPKNSNAPPAANKETKR